jgi:pimeloyl-ACP methyl ester carboxylesterase
LLLASRRPDLLSGLVLLDPPPLEFITGRRFPNLREMADEETRKLERAAEAARGGGDSARASFFEILASEHDMMFAESADEVMAVDDLGALPLVVVGSGVPNPMFGDSAEAFQEFWVESNRRLASISRRGRFVLAPESSHRLHEEASDLVLQVIEDLVRGRE